MLSSMRFGLCFSYVEMLTNEINEFGFVWPLKRSPIYRSCAGWTIWWRWFVSTTGVSTTLKTPSYLIHWNRCNVIMRRFRPFFIRSSSSIHFSLGIFSFSVINRIFYTTCTTFDAFCHCSFLCTWHFSVSFPLLHSAFRPIRTEDAFITLRKLVECTIYLQESIRHKRNMPCHANKQQKMKKTTAAPAVTTTTETMRFLDTEKPEYQCENPNHDTTRFKCTVRAICSAESWCSTVKSFADDFCLTTTTTLNCYWWRIDKVVHMESGRSITNVKHFKISLLHFLCLCFFSTFPSSLKLKFCRIFASHSRQVTCIKCSFFRYTLFFHQVFYTCFVLFIQLLASQ